MQLVGRVWEKFIDDNKDPLKKEKEKKHGPKAVEKCLMQFFYGLTFSFTLRGQLH